MPASLAITGRLARLKYGDSASAEAFTAIGETKTFTFNPAGSKEMVDISHHNSPSGWREYAVGMRDGDMVEVTANFVKADIDILLTQAALDEPTNYQVVLADANVSTFQFAGYVQTIPVSAPFDGPVEMSISIKTTGPITDETV